MEGTRRAEIAAADELKENGYHVPPRLKTRATPEANEDTLPNTYHDVKNSAWWQIPKYKQE